MTQNRGIAEGLFEEIERLLTIGGPDEGLILSEQIEQGSTLTGVTFDEATVEVREAKETLHILDISGCFPFTYRFDLNRVHLDSISRYDEAKERRRRNRELAFLGLDAETSLHELLQYEAYMAAAFGSDE